MSMVEISIERARKIAEMKKLRPGRVRGTEGVQFTKGNNGRVDVIDWGEFEDIIKRNGLAIYESGGWMKIMKKK